MIKPLGQHTSIILSTAPESILALREMQAKHIAGEGYGFLLGSRALWYDTGEYKNELVLSHGLIGVVEEGMEYANDIGEYFYALVRRLITNL